MTVAAAVASWPANYHTSCLCQLGATHTPYTCLTVYAASAVPDCSHCSAPCSSALSLGCDADTDEYAWVLRVLDVALGSCHPWGTSVVVYQALQHLLARTQPDVCTTAPTSTCSGPTKDETALEQATTRLLYLAQLGHGGTGTGPSYHRLALPAFALTPDAVRTLVDGCGATSSWSVGARGDTQRAVVQSLRALYRLRQQLVVWIGRLELARQVHQLDTNAVGYALAQATDDAQWRDTVGRDTSFGGVGGAGPCDRDTRAQRQRLEAAGRALVAVGTDWETLQRWYAQALTLVDAQCVTATGTLVYQQTHATTTTADGTPCGATTSTAWTASTIATSPTDSAEALQRVRALLDRAATYVDQRSLALSWNDAGTHSPALDRQVVCVSVRRVRLDVQREMHRVGVAFLNNVYGSTVPTSVTVPNGSAAAFQQQAKALRAAVARADGTRWVDGGVGLV